MHKSGQEESAQKKKQAKKARAEQVVKCSLAPGKRKVRRKPLSELHVSGNFTGDSEEWQRELQRHCEEVDTDQEETREAQEKRIEYFRKAGDQHFTDDGRGAEITVDLVLQARAKMADNKVNGPEDTVVSEMIKQLLLGEDLQCYKVFSTTLHGPDGGSRKPDADPMKGMRSYRAMALTSVMSKRYASSNMLRLEKEKEPESARDCMWEAFTE